MSSQEVQEVPTVQMNQSPSIAKLAKAICTAQRGLKPVKKEVNNPFFNKKYADLAAVWEALKPFHENGIAITQSPVACGRAGHICLETQLTHESGEWMRSTLELPLTKNDPQGAGSALTYARRYALGCMTGVVTEEDDDGNAASGNQHQPAQAYTKSKQASAKKLTELTIEGIKPEARGAGTDLIGVSGPPPQASDSAPPAPFTDENWNLFLDYMDEDPERTAVGKQLKDLLKIAKVAALKGSARSGFVRQFQDSCRETGVPCEAWVA
jgi:hypothetical protein